MGLKLYIYLLFYMIYLVSADYCESRESCSECITTADCAWCAKFESKSRCFHRISGAKILSECEGFVQDKQSKKNVLEENPFNSNSTEVIQITPQKIKIDLRVGESVEFNFKYKQAENYPVDLYFLLDASKTMEYVRTTITEQSEQIIKTMRNFTRNIRLGFGTFVDKNTLPYVGDPGMGAYSFRHQMSLEDNVMRFTGLMNNTNSTGNFDTPEGGLDGLAQVLACEEVIGWSPHSRKIILFITDAPYHAAGDGIIAGIHQPYDGKCYTTIKGKYMKELEMDYPSVAMIYKLAKKQEAIIIFIVEESVKMIYKDLADYIGGKVKSFEKNKNKNKNENDFHEILKEVYQDKTNFIKLKKSFKQNSKNAPTIKFNPDCSIENFESGFKPDDCAVIEHKEINIIGNIRLPQYVNVDKYNVHITVDGLNEQLQLEVNVITKCDCEDVSNKTPEATQCSKNGTLICGLCECNSGWFGPQCLCTKDGDDKDLSTCKSSNDSKVCTGNGNCVCGACECYKQGDQKLYCGSYCQIEVNDCQVGSNGKLCSGSDHGKCDCGLCHCHQDWEGLACDTSKLTTNCIRNNKMCNERGICKNNTCVCDPAPEWDARQNTNEWCGYDGEPKTDDLRRQCSLLEENARCAYKKESCFGLGTQNNVKANLEEKIDDVDRKIWAICEDTRVAPGCYIKFFYKYDDENRKIQLLVAKNADCLENYYMAGGGTFAALLIGGICALVGWKIVTTRRDRREYEQFLLSTKQRTSSVRTNVLYTSPTRTIDNPAYVDNKNE